MILDTPEQYVSALKDVVISGLLMALVLRWLFRVWS